MLHLEVAADQILPDTGARLTSMQHCMCAARVSPGGGGRPDVVRCAARDAVLIHRHPPPRPIVLQRRRAPKPVRRTGWSRSVAGRENAQAPVTNMPGVQSDQKQVSAVQRQIFHRHENQCSVNLPCRRSTHHCRSMQPSRELCQVCVSRNDVVVQAVRMDPPSMGLVHPQSNIAIQNLRVDTLPQSSLTQAGA